MFTAVCIIEMSGALFPYYFLILLQDQATGVTTKTQWRGGKLPSRFHRETPVPLPVSKEAALPRKFAKRRGGDTHCPGCEVGMMLLVTVASRFTQLKIVIWGEGACFNFTIGRGKGMFAAQDCHSVIIDSESLQSHVASVGHVWEFVCEYACICVNIQGVILSRSTILSLVRAPPKT